MLRVIRCVRWYFRFGCAGHVSAGAKADFHARGKLQRHLTGMPSVMRSITSITQVTERSNPCAVMSAPVSSLKLVWISAINNPRVTSNRDKPLSNNPGLWSAVTLVIDRYMHICCGLFGACDGIFVSAAPGTCQQGQKPISMHVASCNAT